MLKLVTGRLLLFLMTSVLNYRFALSIFNGDQKEKKSMLSFDPAPPS